MSCRRLKVSGTLVNRLLLSIDGPYISDLPKDIQVRDIRWDDGEKLFILLVESDEWAAPKEGMVFPFIYPMFSRGARNMGFQEEIK